MTKGWRMLVESGDLLGSGGNFVGSGGNLLVAR